jgi:predicted enzyme related to lactoylglutathione lyase
MANNPVGWFEIYVQNMARAKKFYESVFQVKLEKLESGIDLEMWNFPSSMENFGASGALVKMQGVPSGGNSTLVYFSCANCSIELGRIVASGGIIQKDKFPIGQYGFIALCIDTEGNMFGLHSMK